MLALPLLFIGHLLSVFSSEHPQAKSICQNRKNLVRFWIRYNDLPARKLKNWMQEGLEPMASRSRGTSLTFMKFLFQILLCWPSKVWPDQRHLYPERSGGRWGLKTNYSGTKALAPVGLVASPVSSQIYELKDQDGSVDSRTQQPMP